MNDQTKLLIILYICICHIIYMIWPKLDLISAYIWPALLIKFVLDRLKRLVTYIWTEFSDVMIFVYFYIYEQINEQINEKIHNQSNKS